MKHDILFPEDIHNFLTVRTETGSTYYFDNVAMTWSRESDHPILFAESVNGGRLAAPVEPRIGQRLTFFRPGDEWVTTSKVVAILAGEK